MQDIFIRLENLAAQHGLHAKRHWFGKLDDPIFREGTALVISCLPIVYVPPQNRAIRVHIHDGLYEFSFFESKSYLAWTDEVLIRSIEALMHPAFWVGDDLGSNLKPEDAKLLGLWECTRLRTYRSYEYSRERKSFPLQDRMLSDSAWMERATQLAEKVVVMDRGLVMIHHKSAAAMIRLVGRDAWERPYLMHPDLRETDDEVELLRLIGSIEPCILYDYDLTHWISLDDPYYGLPSHGPRPERPQKGPFDAEEDEKASRVD
jgi:hypothetical protein